MSRLVMITCTSVADSLYSLSLCSELGNAYVLIFPFVFWYFTVPANMVAGFVLTLTSSLPVSLLCSTLRMDYDFDPTPDHPEEETIYDPWPSLWRDLASELVNKPTLTKTGACLSSWLHVNPSIEVHFFSL